MGGLGSNPSCLAPSRRLGLGLARRRLGLARRRRLGVVVVVVVSRDLTIGSTYLTTSSTAIYHTHVIVPYTYIVCSTTNTSYKLV